jgi:hypothetical protein
VRRLLVFLALLFLIGIVAANVRFGPEPSHAGGMTSGDSALAAAGTFKIYPFYTPGGAHIHNSQWVADAAGNLTNGYQPQAATAYVYTSLSALRVIVFQATGNDTAGFTLPAGGTWLMGPYARCDSISVLNTGGTATTVTWGLSR